MAPLQIHNLTIKRQQQLICQNLNIDINPGECWVILGPNGVGKTTLLQHVGGLLETHLGDIKLNHRSIFSYKRKQLAQKIGFLLQHHDILMPAEVHETVLSGRYPHVNLFQPYNDIDLKIVEQLMAEFDLTSLKKRLLTELSGGELQRTMIATVFAQTPDYYLLDEPNNHLDLHYQIKLFRYLKTQLTNNKSILMTLQDINLATMIASHLILIQHNGYIITGLRDDVLNETNLSDLYQQALKKVTIENRSLWYVDF